ncbi:hypothetical protein Sango_2092100 [Sesamum angolense]|uniref:Reverse transcriptase/retrotransposon-derived protein RNase H-like domain-containing protein n=1 Tax=Sesamum angolense TaxID=2727404 RepID=A0AAE2BLZ3_9LAMI|nr:hypothetical protein Sango_2092100 [Sesamum angolense]
MNLLKCAFGVTSGKFLGFIENARTSKHSRALEFARKANISLKKDVPFQWNETCDKAFKSIKSYLMKPPVLVAPVPGRPLILFVATQERSMGILLA